MKRIAFNPDLCSTNIFVSMASGSQALYFHSLIIADPDGLVDRETAVKSANSTDEEMKELIEKGYVIDLGSVVAIKHWYIHNTRKPNQQADTIYPDARDRLRVKAGIYFVKD